jgi:hypothetical protein
MQIPIEYIILRVYNEGQSITGGDTKGALDQNKQFLLHILRSFLYNLIKVTIQHRRHSGCFASLVVGVQSRSAPYPPTKYE